MFLAPAVNAGGNEPGGLTGKTTVGLSVVENVRCKPSVKRTKGHKTVFRLLHQWISGKIGHDVPCTSMTLNGAYAAKLHRDGNNDGPSVAVCAGDFEEGGLLFAK